MRNVLFIADPMSRLRPLGDSTLALVREVLARGHMAYWATGDDLEFRGDHLVVHASQVEACAKDELAELGAQREHALASMDTVFIRKDPPFDAGYVKLCWLLGLAERSVKMINPPSILLRYHEKLVPLEAVAQGFLRPDDLIPTHIGTATQAQDWVRRAKPEKVVVKPFLGFGGNGVSLQETHRFLTEGAMTTKGASDPADQLVQPFRPEVVARGDRRVLYLGGKILADFVRMPQKGNFISNLAQGGSAVAMPMTAEERDAAQRLGKFLAAAGILFAGSDMIGRFISEVNITSPTGLRSLEKLEGKDYASDIITFASQG